jgi:hypothetical protein
MKASNMLISLAQAEDDYIHYEAPELSEDDNPFPFPQRPWDPNK